MSGPAAMAAVFVLCLLVAVPIPIAAGIATIAGLLVADIPLTLIAQSSWTAYESFPLVTIPLFVLAGKLMEHSGMSEKLIDVAKHLVGAYRGGLGQVTVIGCMLFAALSGSGPATTAAIGSSTIPGMAKEGYPPRFSAAIAASAGALGSMIPPSNLLIIFALVTDVSIPRLFLAGIVPGVIVGILLMVVVMIVSARSDYGGTGEKTSLAPLLWAVWQGKWALMAPILILGGIYTGIFTPSEAAGVAVAYSLFVGFVVHRRLTLAHVIASFRFTTIMVGTILLILGSTKAFGQLVTLFDIPESVLELFLPFQDRPWLIMLMIGGLYVIVGMWLESIPQIIIFTAVFFPLVTAIGIDPVAFGVFTVLACEIGFLTPPIGVNLFVAARIANITVEQVSLGVLPLLVPYALVLVAMAIYSDWVAFLPNLAYGVSN